MRRAVQESEAEYLRGCISPTYPPSDSDSDDYRYNAFRMDRRCAYDCLDDIDSMAYDTDDGDVSTDNVNTRPINIPAPLLQPPEGVCTYTELPDPSGIDDLVELVHLKLPFELLKKSSTAAANKASSIEELSARLAPHGFYAYTKTPSPYDKSSYGNRCVPGIDRSRPANGASSRLHAPMSVDAPFSPRTPRLVQEHLGPLNFVPLDAPRQT